MLKKNKPKNFDIIVFNGKIDYLSIGGLDLGFQVKRAGFDILWANDFDKDS